MICKALEEWSETESSDDENELIQPNRDFPISSDSEAEDGEVEYEDEVFDISELVKKTINKNMADDFFVKEEKKKVKPIKNEPKIEIKNDQQIEIKTKEKRKFNPRLPPPNKYNKNNANNNKFNFNLNDFPTL